MKFYAYMGPDKPAFHCSDARRFSHYVNNVRFWFAVHRPIECKLGLTVSHWETGMRVCDISTNEMRAAVGIDWPGLARVRLDRLCEEKTAARVYDVIRRAEKQGYGMLKGAAT